ncbi:hypothetical protein Lalb_Chr16g0380431 [Lupinus albus]|uniref:Uncharacterized protein n=1 Tax=Lupinus albus TaxID=3870 RepID=A0A6A4P599_LUPAL|nr:hypothetical protein Lalb_Chr16g0380431 [Lupinus albus]
MRFWLKYKHKFLDLIKSIGECRSKSEEDRIVLHEIQTLKTRLTRKIKEYIIRLLYGELLGHDASFGYIHAVKITHHDAIQLKRSGYLAITIPPRQQLPHSVMFHLLCYFHIHVPF